MVSLRFIESGEQIPFGDRSELLVGRAHKNVTPDIDLAPHDGKKMGVSRNHARLIYIDEQWFIEDLNSTNGTYLNGVKLPPNQPQALKQGDFLRFGVMELQFSGQVAA